MMDDGKLVIEPGQTFKEVSIDINHPCFMIDLSRELDQEIVAHSFLTQFPERNMMHVYCGVRESFTESEIEKILGKLKDRFSRAKIYAPGEATFFDLQFEDVPISTLFSVPNSMVKRYKAMPERENVTIIAEDINLPNLLTKFDDTVNLDILSIKKMKIEDIEDIDTEPFLPDDELSIVNNLINWGYYELPKRGITIQDAAKRLELTDAVLSQKIRTISESIFKEYLRQATIHRK